MSTYWIYKDIIVTGSVDSFFGSEVSNFNYNYRLQWVSLEKGVTLIADSNPYIIFFNITIYDIKVVLQMRNLVHLI